MPNIDPTWTLEQWLYHEKAALWSYLDACRTGNLRLRAAAFRERERTRGMIRAQRLMKRAIFLAQRKVR